MSCKEFTAEFTAAVCKSKQNSRAFYGSRDNSTHDDNDSQVPECIPSNALFAITNDYQAEEAVKIDKKITRKNGECNTENQTVIASSTDTETVADIEKWLKTRMESVSSIDLDTAKMMEGVDRYLGDDLSHGFLGKDPYGLSIDIDLSDKKLNMGYDPILQDLHSEKLLEPCEKVYEFILPEFPLDHLDPLTLSSDDIMVAGEILPSTSNQPALNVENQNIEICNNEETAQDCEISCEKPIQITVNELPVDLEGINQTERIKSQHQTQKQESGNSSELFMETFAPVKESLSNCTIATDSRDSLIEQLKSKTKVKLEPRIIKKRRKISERLEKKFDKRINGKNFGNPQDGVMAVVAISTDKISNMTQIVINTGTEKQIYQGKTSELIEATGNFPKLPKIDTSAVWNSSIDYGIDNNPSNQYEIVISNALEELGITDDSLQPICVTEHDKVWLCPRDDCNRQFGRLYTLKGHLLAHYGVRPFKCDFEGCTWAFYSEFKLKRHKETHLKRKDYICEVEGCNRRFTTIYNLWSHEKLHSRPNRIVCQVPDCEEKFQTKRALELHMKSHDQRHAPYVCQHEGCGKRYYSSNALTSHQRSHSYKEVDVKCSWPGCGKIFDKPCRLKAHTRSHTGCKPYHCTFQDCKWAFSSSSKLKRHQKKHTNERKFVCDVLGCGKAFMRSEHLKEHRLTHTEGRYFQCFVCDARFSAKSSLYVHIKKHKIKTKLSTNIPEYTSSNQKRVKAKESYCSRVKSIVKLKEQPIDSNVQILPITENFQLEVTDTCNDVEEEPDVSNITPSQTDQLTMLYHCPMEICTCSYTNEAILRSHILKAHGTSIGACEDSLVKLSSDANMDYILYTVPSSTSSAISSTKEMVMVTACDTVILSTSSETDHPELELEPPPFNVLLKSPESSQSNKIDDQTQELQEKKKYQGSARTDLTFSDVSRLKTNGIPSDSVVETSDVMLGMNDLTEGLLLTEELPSMYYQDDAAGTEYQVLLLDSGSLESTGNLRGLE